MNDFVRKLARTKGKKRSRGILVSVAKELKVEPDALGAFIEVEAAGSGFDSKGRLKILFEKHHFYKHLPAAKREHAVKAGLARRKWISPKAGGYNDQKTSDAKWKLLDQAAQLDETAALKSASLGAGQVLGSHAEWLGFLTPQLMWERNAASEDEQIQTMGFFIRRAGLVDEMQRKDWKGLARGYNGPGQVEVYAPRLRTAYNRLQKIPDEPLPPEEAIVVAAAALGPIAPLRCGDMGEDVVALQKALVAKGYTLKADGDFGAGTEAIVKLFQQKHDLVADGCVGRRTRAALGLPLEPQQAPDDESLRLVGWVKT